VAWAPPEEDAGPTDAVPERAELWPDVPEPEFPAPDVPAAAEDPAWPVVAWPCAAPCVEPGSAAAMVPDAAALATPIPAVIADSRRMPRRLSAEGVRGRLAGLTAIGPSLPSSSSGGTSRHCLPDRGSGTLRSGISGVLLNRL